MIHVAINGYGTIGRRVADAVMLQEDMNVVGISKTRPDYVAKIASRNYRIFVPDRKAMETFSAAGISVYSDCRDIPFTSTENTEGICTDKRYEKTA